MTNRLLSLVSLIAFLSILSACHKDDPPPPQDNFPQYLLKSITLDNGLTATSSYGTDSSLQDIAYAFGNVSSKTVFGYAGKRLMELYDDRSMYKTVIDYSATGSVASIRSVARVGSSPSGYLLEFQYNTDHKVDSLKYFSVNETGKHLQYTSKYQYNSTGDLVQVITQSDNSIITHTIAAYSPAVSFNPGHYLETALNENYTIYNYAVLLQLQQSRKLPAKVTRLVKTGADPVYVDKIEEQIYSVTNYRIDSVQMNISYPGTNYKANYKGVYNYY